MPSFRLLAVTAALAGATGCHDSTTAPPKPAAVRLSAGADQSGVVGQMVSVAPTFVVTDAGGAPLAGIPVSVTVTTGGGTLADAPSRSAAGATAAGTWTLGPSAGAQTLTITVAGLPPVVATARAAAGAPAHLVALTPGSVSFTAGEVVSPAPSARVVDAFNNAVANAPVTITTVGGGAAPSTVTADSLGVVTVAGWRLGTTVGQNALTLASGSALVSFLATVTPGAPANVVVTGAPARAPAGSTVSGVALRVVDRYGNAVPSQSATFGAPTGGGSLASTVATGGADGVIAVPSWTLGRSAVTQTVHAVAAGIGADVSVPIASDYNIDVRFFGDPMTDEQKGWFTNAAARISAAVVGDVPDVTVSNLSVSQACGISGLPVLNETVDDLVIYAAVSPIDGPGHILAEAGPCVFRNNATGGFTVVGVMLFDSEDMARMAQQNITQDVITHEMLHVVGIGTLWQIKGLITGAGTTAVTYWGAGARQGCLGAGGAAPCATSVPVENNLVLGTTDSHWRETTFGNELMTGYANVGGMPFSAVTVGSLGDMGYQVNPLAADPYVMPGVGGATGNRIPGRSVTDDWEKTVPSAVILGASPFDPPTFVRRPK